MREQRKNALLNGKEIRSNADTREERYVTLNGEKINMSDAYRRNAIEEPPKMKILRPIIFGICMLGMVIVAKTVIVNNSHNPRNYLYVGQVVPSGITTRREASGLDNRMSEQEVLDWAEKNYGPGNFVAEVVPNEDSLVTDHTNGRVWRNDFDPEVKYIVLGNGDTMVVVGPGYLNIAEGLIEACKKSHYEDYEEAVESTTDVQDYPTPTKQVDKDLPTLNPQTGQDYPTPEPPMVVPAGSYKLP